VSGGTVSVTNGISVANSSILNIGGGTVTATGIGIAAGSVMTNIGGTLNIPAITNNGTLTFNRGNTLSFSGALSGAGTNRIDGGTLTLTASNSFTGAVAVNAGVLNLNSSSGSAAGSVSGITVASNATLLLSQSGQVNDNAAITLSGGTISRASGVNEVFGNLNLAGASALDFGSGTAGSLQFGTYTRDTGSALLTVQNFFQGNSLVFSQNLIAAGYIDASSSGSYSNGYFAFADGFTTSWNGTDTFTITAIPEPSTLLAASALLAVFLWPLGRRWRRQFAGRLR
jgi:autotransporter-associated beta strand protein